MMELVIPDCLRQIKNFRGWVSCIFYNSFYGLPVMVVENFFRIFDLFYLTLKPNRYIIVLNIV